MPPKALVVLGLLAFSASRLTTCRSPGEGGGDRANPQPDKIVEVKGIDTSALTARERASFSSYASELLSPCPDQPVSVAQCVNESRACASCVPAARTLVEQVRRGRTRSQVETFYRARFGAAGIKNLDLTGSASKGPEGAPVVIVEFADFECPACAAARPVVDELYDRHRDKVRVVFKHFPLGMHPNAEKAARAAVAAGRQGKFWEMYALLFENQTRLAQDNVEKLAADLGLDLARFRQDRDSEATADSVAKERKQGEALTLDSTPSLFINGRQFPATTDFKQDLEEWVVLELSLKGVGPAPAPSPSAAASAKSAP